MATVTAIYSGSVEPPSLLPSYETPKSSTKPWRVMETTSLPVCYTPSPLASSAARFVNAASQDTLCPGLCELAEKNEAYCLGTDFKAGQTKFKTQVVEYLELHPQF